MYVGSGEPWGRVVRFSAACEFHGLSAPIRHTMPLAIALPDSACGTHGFSTPCTRSYTGGVGRELLIQITDALVNVPGRLLMIEPASDISLPAASFTT